MSKLNKYLTESEEDILKNGPVLWNILKKECKYFINEYKKTGLAGKIWFYRGSEKKLPKIGIDKIKVRKNRRPRDTPQEIHEMIDSAFKDAFGWYVRSEGVFTISYKSSAKVYGTPYLFFPVGKYKYVWSTNIEDIFEHLDAKFDLEGMSAPYQYGLDYSVEDDYERRYGEGGEGYWEYEGETVGYSGDTREDAEEAAIDIFGPEDFDPGLLEWIPELDLESYIEDREEERKGGIEFEILKIIDTYTDKDMKGALKSYNETVFKCDYYYLVDEKYSNFLEQLINEGHYQLKLFKLGKQMKKPKYYALDKKGFLVFNA